MLRSRATWKFSSTEEDEITDINDILQQLFKQRGLYTKEDIENFLSPKLDQLQSPADLAMIDQAVKRVKNAIMNDEKILIYGDYDADGVTSTTLLLKTIQELEGHCTFYIPNRFEEGYGLNEDAIYKAKDKGVSLIITVDTGITSFDEVNLARDLNIDMIITDHHDIQEKHPDALAVIHPELSPNYSFKQLAGVGIAFKFAEHLLGYFPKQYLDLVAIGTIADLVPLVGENRILSYYGLKQLEETENIGLKTLKKQCNISGVVSEEDVGFRIGPRINAVGRISDAELAVQLLLSEDEIEAKQIVKQIEQLNNKRQQLVQEIVEEAENMVVDLQDREVIFLANENWHEGVLGIVASRLAKKYYRPTFIFTVNETTGELKGSARSIPSFDLFSHCMEIRHLFTSFGGHSQAAGMTLQVKHQEDVIQFLNARLAALNKIDLEETIEISHSISLAHLTESFVEQVEKLAPFGMENPKPIFHIKDTPQEINQIGRNKNHLKLQYVTNGERFDAIGFNFGHLYKQIAPNTPISIVGELGINEWNGFKTVQMIMEDIAIYEWQLFDHRGKAIDSLNSLINGEDSYIIIAKDTEQFSNIDNVLTYDEALSLEHSIKQLFIFDLPEKLIQLQNIIKRFKPEQIHACFQLGNSLYLQAFPTRDQFKWLYTYVYTEKSFDFKSKIPKIMKHKNWSKDFIIFMLHVFHDLGFITSESGMIKYIPNPEKRPLHESTVFKERKEKIEIEKALYFSTYKQLKQLFNTWICETTEEETTNGL